MALCSVAGAIAVAPALGRAQSMFTHQVPIKLPHGTNGMEPQLALVYNPMSGNGVAGVGWQLSGVSQITRVNYGRGVNFDGVDTYAHSQLGVLVRQPDGSYRTKRETFTKIVPSGTCGDGPCSWIAYDRSGTAFHYGTTSDSAPTVWPTASVHTWALSKVVDLFGNSYEVAYWVAIPGCEIHPSTITYTKGPGLTKYRTVEFTYESRPDVEAQYNRGTYQMTSYRLKWITVKSDGTLIRKYRLDYNEVGATTGRSHLTAVQEIGNDNVAALPAQTFEWQQGGAIYDNSLQWSRWGTQQGSFLGGDTWATNSAYLPGDFDGDGKADVAYLFHDGAGISVDVHQSTGNGFSARNWIWQGGYWGGDFPTSALPLTGDFNGDGKTDIAYIWNDSSAITIDVLHVPTGYGSSMWSDRWAYRQGGWVGGSSWQNSSWFTVGDFDGDGKADIAYAFNDGGQISIDVHLSNGSAFTLSRWITQQGTWQRGADWQKASTFLVGDFNGDGKTDIAYAYNNAGTLAIDVYQSTGSSFALQRNWTTDGAWLSGDDWATVSTFIPADYDGDGKTDIARVYNTLGLVTIDVYKSHGQTFGREWFADRLGPWVGGADWRHYGTFIAGDFNGDGKADIVHAWNDNVTEAYDLYRSTGTEFLFQDHWGRNQGWWQGGFDWDKKAVFVPGDFDGDGKMDLAYIFNDNGSRSLDVHYPGSGTPDLMTRVSNGLAGQVTVTYAPAAQVPGAIAPTSSAPGIPLVAPLPLATSVQTSDGRGGTYQTNYSYSDVRIYPGTPDVQRSLGFARVSMSDPQSGSTATTYSQTPGYEGSVLQVDSLANNGQLVSQSITTYDLVNPSTGTELIRERTKVAKMYELGTMAFTQTTNTTYDAFGNPTIKDQLADNLPTVTVTTTFTNDTANWLLGRITEVKTTSGAATLGWMKNTWTGNVISDKQNWLDTTSSWVVTTMTYDPNGNIHTVTEPPTGDGITRTTTTDYDFNFNAYPRKVTNALGQCSQRGHNADGLITSVTDVNGNVTITDYDELGRKKKETRPDTGTTDYTYLNYGNASLQVNRTVTKVDATRSVTRDEYFDGSGFVYHVETTGDLGQTICLDNAKDAAGRTYQTSTLHYSGSSFANTTTTYDPAGRLKTITTPDGKVSSRAYGTNWESSTDANGKTTTRYFNGRKQVTEIVDPALQHTYYGYDPLGRLTSVQLPNGDVNGITYDTLNRKTSLSDPLLGGAAVSLSYDGLNRVKTKQPASGPLASYTYDEAGVLNGLGRVTTVTDGGGTTRFAYTSTGQVGTIVKTIDGSNYTQGFTYDYAGRLTHLTYPDGSYVDYSYTDGGNLSTVSLNGATLATWMNYNASGKPQTVTYGNGVSTAYVYDVMNHMTALTTTKGSATLQDLTYDWYASPNTGGLNIGSITDRRTNKTVSGVNTDESQTYTYDDLYRLTQAVGVWGTKSYGYDSIGNVTTFGGLTARTLTFTGQQLSSGTGLSSVTYDGAGNLTHRVLDGATWDYAWTGENQLASATKNGAMVGQFTYDADGQRVKKVYLPGTSSAVTTMYIGKLYEKRVFADASQDKHTLHVFANGQHLMSWTRAGPVLTASLQANRWRAEVAAASMYDGSTWRGAAKKAAQLVRAAGVYPGTARWAFGIVCAAFAVWVVVVAILSGVRKCEWRMCLPLRIRMVGTATVLVFALNACSGNGIGPPASSTQFALVNGDTTRGPAVGTYYYHRNQINSSAVVTDATGNEASRIVYLPFGETSSSNSAGTDTVTAKFTGQELDEELGLYYYGARYYDPSIGRFISADSLVPNISDAQTLNRYCYVKNNPISYVDPTGHFLDFIGDALTWVNPMWALSTIVWAPKVVNSYIDSAGTAWAGVKQMVSNPDPATIVSFVIAAGVAAYTRDPAVLALWAKATGAALAATSMASAAGISDPAVLGIIGAMAGAGGAGATSIGEFIKTGAAWAASEDAQLLEGDRIGYWLAPLNGLGSAFLVNGASGAMKAGPPAKWVATPYGWVDPSFGLNVGGAAEAGVAAVGVGLQISGAGGYFWNPGDFGGGGFGCYESHGGFLGTPWGGLGGAGSVGGASLGAGPSVWYSNASSTNEIRGPFRTLTVNVLGVQVQYSWSGGTWTMPSTYVFTAGYSFGPPFASYSLYTTKTTYAAGR